MMYYLLDECGSTPGTPVRFTIFTNEEDAFKKALECNEFDFADITGPLTKQEVFDWFKEIPLPLSKIE